MNKAILGICRTFCQDTGMQFPPPSTAATSVTNIIRLNEKMLNRWELPLIQNAIRSIVRNVHFEFIEHEYAIRLLGPDMYYHAFDPFLSSALERFDPKVKVKDILMYRSSGKIFDLCFEDSWSGYFIAEHLRRGSGDDDLIIIHLDDHTDMMSTLLEIAPADVLLDPMTGRRFDPKSPTDWEAAICSGSVGIGCFVTPLFFADTFVHVRHLNNGANAPANSYFVMKASCEYEVIPGKRFAAIRLSDNDESTAAGSYVVSSSVADILDELPRGQVIVHLDLDYFINDFNGNPTRDTYTPSSIVIAKAQHKLDQFFETMQARRVKVDRWIIATSPGFCSACHWAWLLGAFIEKIQSNCHGY
jgi:hypothetical protein